MPERIENILRDLEKRAISTPEALTLLKGFPYEDMGFAKIDSHRSLRRGFPEVVFGKGKTVEQIVKIAGRIIDHHGTLLVTRTNEEAYRKLKKVCPKVMFDKKAAAIYYVKEKPRLKKGLVAVVTAGTADMPVAEEARLTLQLMGNRFEMLCDVGVAGLHRVLDNKDVLDRSRVIIVIAGMEGALASVVSGLVSKPIVAVPTSVGYGASFEGLAALLAMMNSCSPGVAVVNIDNGFGAAYFASLMNT